MSQTIFPAPRKIEAPSAAQRPFSFIHHSTEISDPWHWLKDQGYPEVTDPDILDYLKAENSYFETVMKPQQAMTDKIFGELKGRIKEDDVSVPWVEGDFEYRWAYGEGAQYRTWYRRPLGAEHWGVLLDENIEAGSHEYFRLGDMSISPDGKLMAWSVDNNGSERFTVKVRVIETGELLESHVEETSGNVVWSADSKHFFYVHVSAEWRPYKVFIHTLGTEQSDHLVYEEKDTSFFVSVGLSSSRGYIFIRAADHVTAELCAVKADAPFSAPMRINNRKAGHDCHADHGQGQFIIRTNRAHKNFSLVSVGDDDPLEVNWQTIMDGGDGHYIRGHQMFKNLTVVQERINGLDQVRLLRAGGDQTVAFPEDVYAANIGHNPAFDQTHIRLNYTSMVTPNTVFDYDLNTGELIPRKVQEIPSGYDASSYVTERIMVTARDGARVPVSIVSRKDVASQTGPKPLHLYGYGAYGLGMDPSFSSGRISLLDRGFIYAIAHIRGGDDMGYGWYEDGKLDKRENTFNDFVDCGRALVGLDYTKAGDISISGGSAGGELMGAVVNQAPELFRAVVMHVPFVDVLNTMLDESLPLTPIEWPEWGNPIALKEVFDHIRSYSPYDQIEAKDYPPMMVTGGLNDPRVTYWEPAKWTAKMRAYKTDNNVLVMKINMGAGHGGKSGRFERLHETAEEYSFILMTFGIGT